LMWKEDSAEQKLIKPPQPMLESRIESRQKHYDSTKHILESLGDQEKTQRRLITLYKISNTISGILDLDQLLKNLLKLILTEFGGDRGFIMLYNQHQTQLVPAAALSAKGDIITPKISERIVQEVLATKESLLCENILDDARFRAQDSLIRQNIMATMCIPLIRNNEILGLIHIDSQQRGKFSQMDLDLLTKVATQAAIVIENARFYKVKQEFSRNLLALAQATQSLSSYLRSELIVQDAARYTAQILDASSSALFLGEQNSLRLVATHGVSEEIKEKFVIPSLLYKVLEGNVPMLLNQHNMPELAPLVPLKASFLAVPVSIHPQQKTGVMGILCGIKRIGKGLFTSEDQQLLSILASYTAIALSNATFYEELRQKEQEIAGWTQQLERGVLERTQQLQATQHKLVQSEKMAAIGLLAAGVAHEFNNIIASMYGFAQIAMKSDKYKDRLIQVVLEQSKRACEITERLQSFSKHRGETQELIDIQELIDSVLRLTETALTNEGIKVIKEYQPLPKLLLNIETIQQVVMNILINARHAIEKDGTIIIRISQLTDSQTAQIEFEDDGKGIEPDKLDRIFEPFYTTKGSFGGGTQPGTGIGLAFCYNTIKDHNGEITVRSTLGEGTCFTIHLPIPQQPEKEESASSETHQEK